MTSKTASPDTAQAHPFRLYAHRGASAILPENTLEAFARALSDGADALETDVHVTRDGAVVVHHDRTGHRTAGIARAVAQVTLDEVRRWDAGQGLVLGGLRMGGRGYRVPTLDALLGAFPDVPVNVDIKAHGRSVAARVIEVVRQCGAEARVTLTSVDDATCRAVRALGYRGPVGLGRLAGLFVVAAPRFLLRRFRPPGQALQIPWKFKGQRFDRPEVVQRARELGLRLDYWTIDDPALAASLVALGADGVMSNDPGRVRGAIDRALEAARGA